MTVVAEEARIRFSQLREETGKKIAEIDQMRMDARQALERIRQASAEVGVSKHAEEFKNLVDEHKTAASQWLWVTAGLAVASAAGVWALVRGYPLAETATSAAIAQYVMTRVVAFALASYLTVWAARNYRAHRHLHVVNRGSSTRSTNR